MNLKNYVGRQVKTAILFYQGNENVVAEKVDFFKGVETNRTILKRNSLLSMAKTIIQTTEHDRLSGMIPKQMIYTSSSTIVWEWKSRKVELNVNGSTVLVKLPNLIFVYKPFQNSHYVFAKVRTKIYNAPLPNVSSSGNICWGSSKKVSHNSFESVIKSFESSFFNSEFTHSNNDQAITSGCVVNHLLSINGDAIKTEDLFLTSLNIKNICSI